MVEASPDAIFMLDPAGQIVFVNEYALRKVDYLKSELIGAHFGKVLAPESRGSGRAVFERAMAPDAEPGVYPLALTGKDGGILHTEISLTQVRDGDKIVGLLGVARDVGPRREIEVELFLQHRTLSGLNAIANVLSRSLALQETLRQALEKVVEVTQFDGGVIFLAADSVGELRLAAALGMAEPFVADLAVLPVADSISGRAVLSGEPVVIDDVAATPGATADLSTRLGLRTYVAVPLVAQQQVVGVLGLGARKRLPVSQELVDLLAGVGGQVGMAIQNARLFEQTQQQARTDGLTGLYNRQCLEETFEREMERAQRCGHSMGAMMLDVDGLKKVNDSLGHRAGDEVLRALGEVIRESVRGYEIAARYGGDEFVVVLPETDLVGAEAAAQRLRDNLDVHNRMNPSATPVRVSIGVAAADSHFDRLLDDADHAMYASRRQRVRTRA
jgi:diguanylate cyclase (GGDEF)-like protein/PAS domain S-box-containing protein